MKLATTLAVAVLALSSIATANAAESEGYSGPLASLRIYETSADAYSSERGDITIAEGGGVMRNYRWGGQACSGRNVSEQNTNILARVVASTTVTVTPYYKVGGGAVRCLMGFRLQDPNAYIE